MSLPIQAQTYLTKQYRFGYTVRNKQQLNNDLVCQIDGFLRDTFDVELPEFKQDHERLRSSLYNYAAYGDSLESRVEHLVKLRYAICTSKGYYARFEQGEQSKIVPLAFWYSRHRLDHVWNWRKSQIIRNRYYNYLQDARDKEGQKLLDTYTPIHLVLTVPHSGGIWNGKRFYARELIKAFTAMRKTDTWKQYVYGGEYGIEVKRSANHGLHIHVHSFILQHPEYTVNQAREAIETLWKEQVGNTTDFSGIHYETLYTVEHEGDNYKKNYIKQGDDINHYLAGVMECIKYHFKPDCIQSENGQYDLELIDEILSNTKGVRLYSRFGAFYNVPELNFNNIADTEEDEVEPEIESTIQGVEEQLLNPFTGQQTDEYVICIGSPVAMKYRKESREPYFLNNRTEQQFLWQVPGFSLADVIRLDLSGKMTHDQLRVINEYRATAAGERVKEKRKAYFDSVLKIEF